MGKELLAGQAEQSSEVDEADAAVDLVESGPAVDGEDATQAADEPV